MLGDEFKVIRFNEIRDPHFFRGRFFVEKNIYAKVLLYKVLNSTNFSLRVDEIYNAVLNEISDRYYRVGKYSDNPRITFNDKHLRRKTSQETIDFIAMMLCEYKILGHISDAVLPKYNSNDGLIFLIDDFKTGGMKHDVLKRLVARPKLIEAI